ASKALSPDLSASLVTACSAHPSLDLRVVLLQTLRHVPGRVDVEGRPVSSVEVAMEARWVVLGSQERILGEESSEFGIEVAGFGVVEARLLVPDVACEGEAVLGGVELLREAEVAPGVQVIAGGDVAGVVREGGDAAERVLMVEATGLVPAED